MRAIADYMENLELLCFDLKRGFRPAIVSPDEHKQHLFDGFRYAPSILSSLLSLAVLRGKRATGAQEWYYLPGQ